LSKFAIIKVFGVIIYKNMRTQIIKLDPQKIEKKKLAIVINFLKQGKVVLFPTDTVYGLLADATNKEAVEKIFKIKKRPKTKPISLFVKNIKMAKKFADIDRKQEKFLKFTWPGKITAVLKKKKTKEEIYGVKKDTIAIRIPNYKPLNYLLKKINFPLAQTSANISEKPASGNLKEILKQFKNKKIQPDLIINANSLPQNKASLIIDLTVTPPKILRG